MEKKNINQVLKDFTAYITSKPYFDIVNTKFGCLIIMPMNAQCHECIVIKNETAKALCDNLLSFIVQDYLFEQNLIANKIPLQLVADFYEWGKKYRLSLQDYASWLESYIEEV